MFLADFVVLLVPGDDILVMLGGGFVDVLWPRAAWLYNGPPS